MRDYYKLLGISRTVSEKELDALLKNRIKYIKMAIKDGNVKDKAVGNIVIVLCENFRKTLEHYGSKENYDRALEIKYSKKVKINKDFKFDKNVARKLTKFTALAGVVFVGITIPSTLTTVEVPVYDGDTIETVCEYYGVPTPAMLGETISAHFNGFTEDGSVRLITSKINAYELREKAEKINDTHEKLVETAETYEFYYIVKPGDTATGLKEKYDLVDAPNRELNIGEEIRLVTTNLDIAEEMKLEYEYDMIEPFATDYEYYEVQPGDSISKIASKFGITSQMITKFNELSNINGIQAGSRLKIVYEYVEGKEAYELWQAEEKQTSLSQ